jgi:uncharacterized protein with PIN domain
MTAFLVDAMCGRLARLLRMCGYDTAYALDRGVEADDALLALARAEGRTLVTRDSEIVARADDAVYVDATDTGGQVATLRAAGYSLSLSEPERCSLCNGELTRETGTTPDDAPDPEERPVWRCRNCGQCYWKGSHWDDVRERLA